MPTWKRLNLILTTSICALGILLMLIHPDHVLQAARVIDLVGCIVPFIASILYYFRDAAWLWHRAFHWNIA